MKDINHLVLDFENKHSVSNLWTLNFITEDKTFNNIVTQKKIMLNYNSIFTINNIKNNATKFTVKDLNIIVSSEKMSYTIIKKKFKNYLSSVNNNSILYNTNTTNDLFQLININFLRKERLYTKLKYSRSPAYDIVSGGAAALLAGFIGFLISEKYGFELVDSGDFYYLFMYGVWLTFSLKPLLTSISLQNNIYTLFSLEFFLNFYKTLFFLIIKKFKN